MTGQHTIPAVKQPSKEAIAARAYELWLQRGRVHGYDVDDWLQAEYELTQLPVRVLAELPPPPPVKGQTGKRSLVTVVRNALL